MSRLNTDKIHVKFSGPHQRQENPLPRKYTLTHSDVTGDLFLTIGDDYDQEAISGWYTKLMRDEVLAEWKDKEAPVLHLHCHVSGGITFGPAKWRAAIFREHLPLVLDAIIYGDREFIKGRPAFQQAALKVHFHARQSSLDQVEDWGTVNEYI